MLERLDLVAVDVDGTITHEEPHLHLGAVRALRSLGKRVPIALVTGNPYPIAYALSSYLGLSRVPMGVAENGAVIYLGDEKRLMGDNEVMREVRRFIEEIGYSGYLSEDSEFRYVDVALRLDDHLQERFLRDLLKRGLEVDVTTSGYALHVMPKGVNKGKGLLSLCGELGVDPRNVAAIGDSYNDLDMFSVAGLSIALPNSPKEVREGADVVVGGPGYGYSLPLAVKILRSYLPSPSSPRSFESSPS